MKKRIKSSLCVIIAVALCFVSSNIEIIASADDSISADDTATLITDYADNRILVVLNQETSLSFETITAENFPEIDCKRVDNLSSNIGELVKEKISQTQTKDSAEAYAEAASTFKANLDTNAYQQVLCIELEEAGKDKVLAAIKNLSTRQDITYAGPDYVLSTEAVASNDTYYGQQWALAKIDAPEAWENASITQMVTVGVIDTGISVRSEIAHPDLVGNTYTVLSREFQTGTAVVGGITDTDGHGTHVAGIIAATGNNNTGICGVAPNAKMVSLQVTVVDQAAYASNVIKAINFAANLELPIINMSMGYYVGIGHSTQSYYNAHDALYATIRGYPGLFVCSAGNTSRNTDVVQHYPSNYDLDNVISVAASTRNDTVWSSSNYGQNSVDIFAPGEDILSCYPLVQCQNGYDSSDHYAFGYHYNSGTSMAAPHVSGVAALILMKYPTLTPRQVKDRILNGADPVAAFRNKCVSGGRLNAANALANS